MKRGNQHGRRINTIEVNIGGNSRVGLGPVIVDEMPEMGLDRGIVGIWRDRRIGRNTVGIGEIGDGERKEGSWKSWSNH